MSNYDVTGLLHRVMGHDTKQVNNPYLCEKQRSRWAVLPSLLGQKGLTVSTSIPRGVFSLADPEGHSSYAEELFSLLFIGMRAFSWSHSFLIPGATLTAERKTPWGGGYMCCNQIDTERGCRVYEVQERGNDLWWVETQEQQQALMWCWEDDMCDVWMLDWQHIGKI